MKKILISFIISVLSNASFAQSNEILAKKFISHLSASQWDSAVLMFDEPLRDKVPSAALQQVWNGVAQKLGKFESVLNAKSLGKGDVIDLSVGFEKGSIDFRCPFNAQQKMVGLFLPSQPKLKAKLKDTYQDALYVNPAFIDQQEIILKSGGFEMGGTFTFPKNIGHFPVVIFVHGSGPNDRDESIGPNKIFRDLAKGLATQGIGSIRYDKRTYVHGGKMDINTLTLKEEVWDDATAAIALAKTLKGTDSTRIYIIGHSLGAMSAPQIAKSNPTLAGIVLMAGNARPLETLLVEQYEYLANVDGKTDLDEQKSISALKTQVKNLNKKILKTDSKDLPMGLSGNYWLALKAYNQVEVTKKLVLPILILQGQNDRQVTMTDFEIWQKALKHKKNVSFKAFVGLNHVFLEGSTPSDYDKRNNLPEEVLSTIKTWILETAERK